MCGKKRKVSRGGGGDKSLHGKGRHVVGQQQDLAISFVYRLLHLHAVGSRREEEAGKGAG